jgi:1,4-dihydroxy-2-naphthoate octaprenyltransferase
MVAARPKTLFAAVSPVMIGVALAFYSNAFYAPAAILALLSALLIQIATNFYNDYADHKAGVDTDSRKGPVRPLQSGRITANTMFAATIVTFGLAVLSGGYLMWRGGWPIVVIGALSILFGFLYTAGKYSLANVGIADLFVFLFFGPIAVAGTYYVQALTWPGIGWVAGCAPGILSVAILLVNNIRDIEEDQAAGKRTLVVRFGRNFGVRAYITCIAIAALTPVVVILFFGAPRLTGLASLILFTAIPGVRLLRNVPPERGYELNSVLASTARILFFYSIVYSAGWIAAA